MHAVHLFALCFAGVVQAQNASFDEDPILQFRPHFARSFPVQILLTGIVLSLVVVLFIHLLFTGQYHWPLAPVNYLLQLSGVFTLMVSRTAILCTIMKSGLEESKKWPYMLSYIAVKIPSSSNGVNLSQRITWTIVSISVSGLVQITHIQFLTLLYPSRLEARLIYLLLGPLALVAAVTQLLQVERGLGDAFMISLVHNVCNATLSLIFTIFLLLWGLLVNRRQAWRTDGGTAAFGASALALALISTALNFLYVPREDQYVWLPGLMQAVVLWQSFLGFWWWVGAGSGTGSKMLEEVDTQMKRHGKKQLNKEEKRERRGRAKLRARKAWKEVAGAFAFRNGEVPPTIGVSNHPEHASGSQDIGSQERQQEGDVSSVISSSDNASMVSLSTATRASKILLPPGFARRWFNHVRRAHVIAARAQAVERLEKMQYREREGGTTVDGWGLGNFILGQRRRAPSSAARDSDLQDHERHQGVEKCKESRTLTSPWYWGPLRWWRRQDSTMY